MAKRDSMILNNHFVVSIGPVLFGFSKISNLSDTFEVEAVAEGGSNWYPDFVMKQKRNPEKLVMERGLMRGAMGLSDSALTTGVPVLGVIIMVMDHGSPVKAYSFEAGVITKWEVGELDAMGKNVLVKKIEITHTGLHEVPIPV